MKSFVRFTLVVAVLITFVVGMATAQDLQEQLSKLGSDAAKGYISPILSGWGNDLNSGIYYSADLHDVLGFDLGIKVAMSKFTDDDKTYNLKIPTELRLPSIPGVTLPTGYSIPTGGYIKLVSGVNYTGGTLKANSAVGAKENVQVKTLSGTAAVYNSNNQFVANLPAGSIPAGKVILDIPGGFDFGSLGVPLLMPQLNVGLPLGLEVMLRYVPDISAGDAGKFNYMGYGVRYDIDQWLPMFPIDIAFHFMTQKMNFKSAKDKDIFSASATAYGVEISKKLLFLTVYGGFQLESSKLTLANFTGVNDYGQTITVNGFEVEGANKSRFTVGARLLLLIVNVHAEYSIAKNPVMALGVGISLR